MAKWEKSADRSASQESNSAEDFRRDLLANLPNLISKAMRDYCLFTMNRPPDDSKGFMSYQAGCRAALTHIHLLLKLASWARSSHEEATSPFDAEHLDRLVRQAEAALNDDFIDED